MRINITHEISKKRTEYSTSDSLSKKNTYTMQRFFFRSYVYDDSLT
jgi:hypothetical protein